MKLQLYSDLHLEFFQREDPGERLVSPMPGANVLVLAGDIADGADALRLFSYWPSHPKRVPILYVAGNHEFYGHSMEPMRQKMKEGAAMNNIHFLENERIDIDGVRFLGTTLWTDYRLDPSRSQQESMQRLERGLNDHQLIRIGRKRFSAQDALERHLCARQWLEQELQQPWAGKTVVISHHGPHPGSVHPRYVGNPLNPGFVSDLTDLMQGVDLWLHGHVHDSFDYQVGRCRVVANPAGYVHNHRYAAREDYLFENPAFNKNLLVELDP